MSFCVRDSKQARACAADIMHPMPVCSVSGGDIFDCIQRGNVDQCEQLLHNDRSVLKNKGKKVKTSQFDLYACISSVVVK